MFFTGPPYRKTVQLRHHLPDGSSHIDWMLAADAAAIRPLVTFRIQTPIHALNDGQTAQAERIDEHRPMYLDYEGPVAGDRGHVVRLAAGLIRRWQPEEDQPATPRTGRPGWRLEIQWAGPKAPHCVQKLCVRPAEDADPNAPRRWTVQLIGEDRRNMRE